MNVQTITAIVGLLTALGAAWEQFAASGQPITLPTVLLVLGTALATWMAKRPGDVTKTQAKQLAHDHASEVLRSVSITPPPKSGD
jgi:hypothetical protein